MQMPMAMPSIPPAIELSPVDLVEKLSAIVPPPHLNTVLYHGVLAPNAAWRQEVVPTPPRPDLLFPDVISRRANSTPLAAVACVSRFAPRRSRQLVGCPSV